MKNPILIIVAFLSFYNISFCQSEEDKVEAEILALQGIEECDAGNYEEALILFDKALELDPGNVIYIYEKGYVYYMEKDYQLAIDIIEPLLDGTNSKDSFFQLVGNSYDFLSKDEKALEVYNKGIEKFPESGKLHLEKANLFYQNGETLKAVDEWEKGIEVDPYFPSNYYNLALFFANTEEEIWALLYGEIFMNLEKNSERTYEISKLLYDTYKNTIKIINDEEIHVSITKNVVYIEPDKVTNIENRFETYYEIAIAIAAVALVDGYSLKNLYEMRKSFLKIWNEKSSKDFQNALIDWQNKLMDEGFFKMYSYWLLSQGREKEFKEFLNENESEFDEFVTWFVRKKMNLVNSTKYSRKHYRF